MNNTNFRTIYKHFEEKVRQHPSKPALLYLGTQWTFNRLQVLIDRFAAALNKIGVAEGDKVIVYLPNIPQWIVAFFAVERIGATAIPISIFSTKGELLDAVTCCEPKTIICMDTNFGYAIDMLDNTKVSRIIVTTFDELLPWWKRLINKALKLGAPGRYPKNERIRTFQDMLKINSSTISPVEENSDQTPLMCFTGGTINLTKLLSFSNKSLLESISNPRAMSADGVPIGTGISLLGRPLNECFGLILAMSCLVFAGETLILAPEENVDAFMALIQRKKVNHFLGSPDLFQEILQNPRLDDYDLSSLKYAVTGGDVLPRGLAEGWKKKFNQNIYPAYILTETCGPVSSCPLSAEIPFGSSGKIVPSKKVKFVNSETLEEVPTGEPGEILVSSENMVETYWNDQEETRKSFVQLNGELWFKTGDIGRIDRDGWVYFLSRNTDIILHSGYKITATEIERTLEDHPDVARAAVVGLRDPEFGERIKAFLVLSPGVKGITSSLIIDWCRGKLEPHMVPQHIEFRDMLPTSRTGKLLKRELVTEEIDY